MRCELLLGIYQAADPFGGAEDAEWPPHPYRLHAALVAAACEQGGSEPAAEDVDVLRWLEDQGPPAITCTPVAGRRTSATAWVPRNATPGAETDRYAKAGTLVARVGRTFPTAVPEDPVVTFAWPTADQYPARLAELVESISWLGSSRSPVVCSVVNEAPVPTFTPSPEGRVQARVALPGMTDALLGSRFAHPTPAAAPVASYARGHGRREPPPTKASPFAELIVRRAAGAPQDGTDTQMLTEALRGAVLAHAGDSAPPGLHGHVTDRTHAAFLPILDVDHPGATGGLRGFGLALPGDMSLSERQLSRAAFARVDRLNLPGGRTPLEILPAEGDLWTLAPERWVGPSTRWRSVTPVILDRFPRRERTAIDELLASLTNAGLPEAEIELWEGPAVRGAPLAGRMAHGTTPGKRVHARLRFATPVRGPVLVGRGRFRGVGLFLPETRA